jgi:DNA end-binding protein Ku
MNLAVSWKGSIAFGLIYIPVNLYIATKASNISFNQLHKPCLNRIRYKKMCEFCEVEVKNDEIVKGYNYDKNKYVVFTNDDFEKIKTPKDKSINITQFVDLVEIDPVFYEKTYNIVPTGGEKAFALLKQALADTNKVGIAKVVFGTKENLVALRVASDKLLLNTMYFIDEIKAVEVPQVKYDLKQEEVDLAKQLIMNLSKPFLPEKYYDEYQEKLKKAIEQKILGEEISIPEEAPEHNIINLMDALQESLRVNPPL